MKCVILGAMEEEIQSYLTSFTEYETVTVGHLTVFTGEINGHDVAVTRCGIGKVASSVGCALLIQRYQPDLVINSGSAGGLAEALDIADIVIGSALIQHDVNLTHFGYTLGQPAGMPERFTVPVAPVDNLVSVAQALSINAHTGLIISGDAFIGTTEQHQQLVRDFPNAMAVEMEGAAIAHCCHLLNTPCLVIRAISDHANKESTMTFNEFLPIAAQKSAALVLGLLQQAH